MLQTRSSRWALQLSNCTREGHRGGHWAGGYYTEGALGRWVLHRGGTGPVGTTQRGHWAGGYYTEGALGRWVLHRGGTGPVGTTQRGHWAGGYYTEGALVGTRLVIKTLLRSVPKNRNSNLPRCGAQGRFAPGKGELCTQTTHIPALATRILGTRNVSLAPHTHTRQPHSTFMLHLWFDTPDSTRKTARQTRVVYMPQWPQQKECAGLT